MRAALCRPVGRHDRSIIPPEHFEFYSEKVAWLPDSFLVTDDRSAPSSDTPSRGELQLPEAGFVFSCFNQSIKLSPAIFDVWKRLLKAVEGSVLWLRDNGAAASSNLRNEAAARGVSPERLIFAPRVPLLADHLARQRQADLFLDTLNYNAHTTASDALLVGIPVVTQIGATCAARVGRASTARSACRNSSPRRCWTMRRWRSRSSANRRFSLRSRASLRARREFSVVRYRAVYPQHGGRLRGNVRALSARRGSGELCRG
jgi:Glycosyl transferase family 41